MTSECIPSKVLSISKEELAKLPLASFKGTIHVIDNEKDVDAAVKSLRSAGEIGFDTETRPCFKRGDHNNVALVQLSTASDCYLFRICRYGFHPAIKQLLEDTQVRKIGLSTQDDFHALHKIEEFEPANCIELQSFVKQYEISDNSLAKVYGIVFGKRISKGQRLSNWEAKNLSTAQKNYAALDAAACLEIYSQLTSGNFHPADSPYLKEIIQPEINLEIV